VTHVPNLSQEDVEMMLTNSTDPSVQALAAD